MLQNYVWCHSLVKGFWSCHFKYDDYCYKVSLFWHTIKLKAKQSHTIITVHFNSQGMSANKDISIIDIEAGRTLSEQCVAVVNASISLSVDTCQVWFQTMSKAPVVFLSKQLWHHCSVLVGSRKGYEHDPQQQNGMFHN